MNSISDTDQNMPNTTATDGTISANKDQNNDLWIKKYQPFNLEAHCINKKKREEFTKICLEDQKLKILFIQGPSGCGKNSMIDCFGEQYNYEIVRYTDQKSVMVSDVYGDKETFS